VAADRRGSPIDTLTIEIKTINGRAAEASDVAAVFFDADEGSGFANLTVTSRLGGSVSNA
jgi:hypothetical protein